MTSATTRWPPGARGPIATAVTLVGLTLGGLAVAIGRPPLSAVAAASSQVLVTVGDVTDTTAVLWARGETAAPLTVELLSGHNPPRTLIVHPSRARDLTARTRIDGLAPATRYEYRIRADGGDAVTGHFQTAPMADGAAPLRLVWSADLGARGHCRDARTGYVIFDAMAARRPDRFLFLGDTIYADHRCAGGDVVPGADFVARTLAEFQMRHRYNRADPAVQRFLRMTAVWATWDDHDVRNNFAGPHEPLMPVGRQAFVDYWPVDAPGDDPGRLHRRFRHGRLAEIFVLDTRQYRDQNCRLDDPDKTLLGAAQRRWLVESLAASTATWKLVASSVPLSIPKAWPCGDSWAARDFLLFRTGFAEERRAILRALRDGGVDNVVFLAGDVHFAMLATHEPWPGVRVHELIAGPLAARPQRPRSPDGTLGSRVLAATGGLATFGEVQIDGDGLTARIFDGVGVELAVQRIAAVSRAARAR